VLSKHLAAASEARRAGHCAPLVGAAAALPIATRSVDAIAHLAPFDGVVDKESICREWPRVARPQDQVLVMITRASGGSNETRVWGAGWQTFFAQRGFMAEPGDAAGLPDTLLRLKTPPRAGRSAEA